MSLWPFSKSKKKLADDEPSPFVFMDTEEGRRAYFDTQCRYGDSTIEMGKGTLALVLDASREFPGIPHAVKIEPDGSQTALLKVISEDGGFIVVSRTPPGKGERLVPGDFVVWVPHTYMETVAQQMGDSRSGWVGLIRAKVKWAGVTKLRKIELICRYD